MENTRLKSRAARGAGLTAEPCIWAYTQIPELGNPFCSDEIEWLRKANLLVMGAVTFCRSKTQPGSEYLTSTLHMLEMAYLRLFQRDTARRFLIVATSTSVKAQPSRAMNLAAVFEHMTICEGPANRERTVGANRPSQSTATTTPTTPPLPPLTLSQLAFLVLAYDGAPAPSVQSS